VRTERLVQIMPNRKIDSDLACIHGVPTKRLNEQVKRNPGRFPPDFLLRLTTEEASECSRSRSQFAALKSGSATEYPNRSQIATGSCSLDILHIPSVAQAYCGKVGACRQGLAPKARSIPAQGNPAKREPPCVAGAKSSAALQGRRPMVLRPADATADGAKGSPCRGWRAEYGLRPCRALVPPRILTQGGALPRLPWAGLLHAAGVRNVQTPATGRKLRPVPKSTVTRVSLLMPSQNTVPLWPRTSSIAPGPWI